VCVSEFTYTGAHVAPVVQYCEYDSPDNS
jgi:hypothetical protein